MPWLIPSVIATLSGTVVLALVYLYLYRHYRERSLGIWAFSWFLYGVRFVFDLLMLFGREIPLFVIGSQASSLFSGLFLLFGTYIFLERAVPRLWVYGSGALAVWIMLGVLYHFPFSLHALPTFVFLGIIYIGTGMVLLRSQKSKGTGGNIVGAAFVVWGVHKMDYPFLRPLLWFAPWGFLISAVLELVVAIGILLMYFQRVRKELAESEQRFRMLYEKAPLGYQSLDAKGCIIDVNQEWLNTLGYSRDEVIGRWFGEFMTLQSELVRKNFPRFNTDGEVRGVEFEMVRKDGSHFIASFDGKVGYDEQGQFKQTHCILTDITDRKLAEKALLESEKKYRELADLLPQTVFECDREGNITFGNRNSLAMFGYTGEDFEKGLNVMQMIIPDDMDRARKNFQKSLNGEKSGGGEYTALKKDGSTFPVIIYSSPVIREDRPAGLRGIIVDATERKRAEEALKESERKFRRLSREFNALLDAIPDNLTLQDSNLKILWANRVVADRLGKEMSDIVGQYCYSLWHRRSIPCEPCPVKRSFFTGNVENEVINTLGGIWDVRTIPIKNEEGKVSSVIELGRDITENRELEEQLRQAQKMEAVGQLAGGVAHDFNNILTAIIGYANLLLMKMREDDPLRTRVSQILSLSDRAANLTQGLLAFGRKQIISPRPMDLNEIIRRVEKLLSGVIGEDIEMKSVLTGRKLMIMADSGQMEQVLMNLCTNARDAMPDGGELIIRTELVEPDVESVDTPTRGTPGMYALVSVSDTGVGMDEGTKEKIFEPFFTTKEVGKGTGLGLAMAYGIIKQHHGHIDVESEPGKGATFSIYLPTIRSEEQAVIPEGHASPVSGNETLLVAEDDADLRSLTKSVLEEFGYAVIEAVDGADAVEKFIENKDKVQLLLLDVIMPKKNGKAVYEEIRRIRPDAKALFISGYTANIIHKKGILEEGPNFVSKPVSPTELLSKVREALADKKEGQSPRDN